MKRISASLLKLYVSSWRCILSLCFQRARGPQSNISKSFRPKQRHFQLSFCPHYTGRWRNGGMLNRQRVNGHSEVCVWVKDCKSHAQYPLLFQIYKSCKKLSSYSYKAFTWMASGRFNKSYCGINEKKKEKRSWIELVRDEANVHSWALSRGLKSCFHFHHLNAN